MEWTSDALVLTTRKHGEADLIAEVMTPGYGRHLGLVRAGRSARKTPILQPGNTIRATWKARLATQLGRFTVELIKSRSGEMFSSPVALYSLQHVAALYRLLPERDSHPALYDALGVVLDNLETASICGPLLVRLELHLLQELGYGLDLSACAATGRVDDLAYVSPRSGRAVGREAGQPYHDKLLPLPAFLVDGQRQRGSEISYRDIQQGFQMTQFFLERLYRERQDEDAAAAPFSRSKTSLLSSLEKAYRQSQPWDFLGLPAAGS